MKTNMNYKKENKKKMNTRKKQKLLSLLRQYKRSNGRMNEAKFKLNKLDWEWDPSMLNLLDAVRDKRNIALIVTEDDRDIGAFLGKQPDDSWNVDINDSNGKMYVSEEFEDYKTAKKFFDKTVGKY